MKIRATLALAAGLPTTVSAQETFVVSYSLTEVAAFTSVPVAVPNGSIDPGEGAFITITARAVLSNGNSAIGALTTYPPPFPQGGWGTGTIRGLGSVRYDLIGDNGDPTAFGIWSQISGPYVNLPFNSNLSGGFVQPGGSRVNGFGGMQLRDPENQASGANSNVLLFRGTWTPASYANRTVTFKTAESVLVQPGQGSSLLVAYGSATDVKIPCFEVFTYDLYLHKYIAQDHGQGLNINVAPAPSSLALLGLSALVAGRRRRK